jgi:hypothetical protein
VLGIYVVDHLGIPVDRYGWVYGVFTGALYLLPLLAGALADRFGYKPALAIAFATLTAGYFVLGAATSFGWLCVALGLIAVGGSIIKPTISGTVTRTTVEGSTRPVGFGLYYMMINAGGLIGPVIAAQVRNRTEFRYVFWVSAAACALMLAQALFAFREPVTHDERAAGKSLGRVFAEIFAVLGNWRFVLLLVIFSGFWGMINVLFGFMPLYVETFTDLGEMEAAIDHPAHPVGRPLAEPRGLHLARRTAHRPPPGGDLVPHPTLAYDQRVARRHRRRDRVVDPAVDVGRCDRRRRRDRDLVNRRDDLLGAVLRVLRHDRSARPGGGLPRLLVLRDLPRQLLLGTVGGLAVPALYSGPA